MPDHLVFLALGTNLGDRPANLQAALAGLAPSVRDLTGSAVYETEPWGLADQPKFLNMVVSGRTRLEPEALLTRLKRLETALGRIPSVRWGPRLIDIDLLLYDDRILDTPTLTLPHPRLHERAFVLVPLHDLAPDLRHPRLQKTIHELLKEVDVKGITRHD